MPVNNQFEILINSFISEKVGIANHFLSNELTANLKQNLVSLLNKNQLVKAGIGNNNTLQIDNNVRNDSIYWLDRKHHNEYENDFLDQIDDFIIYLNRSCFAGITGYEFHYSLYEVGGFYKKHTDQFKNNSSRQYSMISYLNDNWQPNDGGELVVYQTYNNKNIAPTHGKTVLFKSNELPHEVLVTQTQRMSITGWLKTDSLI